MALKFGWSFKITKYILLGPKVSSNIIFGNFSNHITFYALRSNCVPVLKAIKIVFFILQTSYALNMENVFSIVLFILGFVLILKGASFLVSSSVILAKKARIPSMVIGATVVAIATTFPETTVALVSCFNGMEEVGISTSVGSMVCNFTIVLGVAFLFLPTSIDPDSFFSKAIFFVISVIVLFAVGIDGRISAFEAIILMLVFVSFIVMNCIEATKSSTQEKIAIENQSWGQVIFEFLISALSIGLGAIVLVNNVDNISAMLGLNNSIVSFIVIAIGTNIPELVTTITSIKLKSPEIGVGNIFGASIIDCTLLVAGSVVVSSGKELLLSKKLIAVTCLALFLITAIISIPIIKNGRSNRKQGVYLIAIYLIYTILLVHLV